MAQSIGGRCNSLCIAAANVIVIIGVFAFIYVGERISRGSGESTITIVAPRTGP